MSGRVALLLLAAACEYDARISVNPPDWTAARSIAVDPIDCEPGSTIRVGFVLVDDRDDPIVDGSSVELSSGAQAIARAPAIAASLEGAVLAPAAGGDPIAIGDVALASIEWRAADDGALALAVEASSEAAAADPGDERFRAADGAARRYLSEPGRRLAVFSLAGGGATERLPATGDVAQAAEAIGAIASLQGGTAPLWDGAIAAGAAARVASSRGGAVLLVGAALVDRGSIADVDDAIDALGATPVRAASLVDDPSWRRLACLTGGAFAVARDAASLSDATAAMVHASTGHWAGVASIPLDGAPSGTVRLTARLRVTIEDDERAAEIDATIEVP